MSYWATILSHAAWPSRSTISRRSRVASSQSASTVRPCSCGAKSKGRRSGLASASAMVIRSPPMNTRPFGLPITNGRNSRPNRSQYASVRSCARGMRMPPASAYKPGANVRNVRIRPPTRCCASRITGSWPCRRSSKAATRPARPAPMTMTRFAGWGRRSRPSTPSRGHRRQPCPAPAEVGRRLRPTHRSRVRGRPECPCELSRPSQFPCAIAAAARSPAQAQEPTSRNELEGSSARIRRVSSAACS